MTAQDYLRTAQAYFESANFGRCRERALEGLQASPEDPALLRLAGQSSLELGLADASGYLRKAVALAPDDADAWHGLGLSLMEEGDAGGAVDALQRAVQLAPARVTALVDLGHTLYALGRVDEAISHLNDAIGHNPGDLPTLRSLVELYRHANQPDSALRVAKMISERWPNDVLATIDAADLQLLLGQLDESISDYGRLRKMDADAGHEVYAYHGMIHAEIQRERWRRALDLAIDAAAIDRFDVTTQLLAYVAVQIFGRSEQPAPTRAELEETLTAEREEHRRAHVEGLAAQL